MLCWWLSIFSETDQKYFHLILLFKVIFGVDPKWVSLYSTWAICPYMEKTLYLGVAVVDKDVPCAVVFQVGDLQATGIPYLGWLKGCVECFNFHHCLGISGLKGGAFQNKGFIQELHFFFTTPEFPASYILLVEVLECSLPLRQDKLSTEELAVVSPSFP